MKLKQGNYIYTGNMFQTYRLFHTNFQYSCWQNCNMKLIDANYKIDDRRFFLVTMLKRSCLVVLQYFQGETNSKCNFMQTLTSYVFEHKLNWCHITVYCLQYQNLSYFRNFLDVGAFAYQSYGKMFSEWCFVIRFVKSKKKAKLISISRL